MCALVVSSCGKKELSPISKDPPVSNSPAPSQPAPLPPVDVPSPLPPSNGGSIVDQQQFMIFHNLKRCWHSAPKIAWSLDLAQKALTVANACDLAFKDDRYSTGHGQGLDIVKALDQWYLEGMIYYPYGRDEIPSTMRRFAAMVWKETREMGCAQSLCNGEPYFVCAYSQGMDEKKASQNVTGLKPDFLGCSGL